MESLQYILVTAPVWGLGLFWLLGDFERKRHLQSLARREAQLLSVPVTNRAKTLGETDEARDPSLTSVEVRLVMGHVVLSVDRARQVVAGLFFLFGGRVQVFESTLDRARREAVLRLREDAAGASEIVNLRIETSVIGDASSGRSSTVEVLAYATGVWVRT